VVVRLVRWLVLAAVLSLGLIIKDIPAEVAGNYLSEQVQGLTLRGLAGSLWRGQAGSASLQWHGNVYALGELHWKFLPSSLLTLSPCAKFSSKLFRQRSSGVACIGLNGSLTVSEAEFTGPAALIELWLPVKVDGSLSIQVPSMTLKNSQLDSLSASASWRDARFHNSHDWLSLGAYAARLSTDGKGGINADIFDIDGPIKIALGAKLPKRGAQQLQGTVRFESAAPRELPELMNALGIQRVDDQYRINWVDG